MVNETSFLNDLGLSATPPTSSQDDDVLVKEMSGLPDSFLNKFNVSEFM